MWIYTSTPPYAFMRNAWLVKRYLYIQYLFGSYSLGTEALPRGQRGLDVYLTTHQPVLRSEISWYIQGVHFARLLDVQNILSADNGVSRQTEGHSFGDHLIIGSVSIMPSSVIEVSIVLCSVSLWLLWINVQPTCALIVYSPIYHDRVKLNYLSTWTTSSFT
jgi:hypothetical protein